MIEILYKTCIHSLFSGPQVRKGVVLWLITHEFVALEEDDTAPLVTRGEIVACRVEFHGGYDVGWYTLDLIESELSLAFSDVLDLALVTETLSKAPSARA